MWRQRLVKPLLWRRIVPDSIDTLLLISGVTLLVMLRLNPLIELWLTIKLALLLAYIALGFIAFDMHHPLMMRRIAWLAALASFVCILLTVGLRDLLAA